MDLLSVALDRLNEQKYKIISYVPSFGMSLSANEKIDKQEACAELEIMFIIRQAYRHTLLKFRRTNEAPPLPIDALGTMFHFQNFDSNITKAFVGKGKHSQVLFDDTLWTHNRPIALLHKEDDGSIRFNILNVRYRDVMENLDSKNRLTSNLLAHLMKKESLNILIISTLHE